MIIADTYAELFPDGVGSDDIVGPDIRPKLASVDKTPVQIDRDRKELVMTFTTQIVDRDKDVVLTQGLNLDSIDPSKRNANPVVLFMHDAHICVAKFLWVKKQKTQGIGKVKFAPTPFAQELFTLYAEGFLRMWSIGMDWATIKRRRPEPAEIRKNPTWSEAEFIVEYADVYEVSAVSIGANPQALNKAASAGLMKHTGPMIERWLTRVKATKRKIERLPLDRGIKRVGYLERVPALERVELSE